MSSVPLPAIFTGAGVSFAPPSSLPLGNQARDDVLKALCNSATPLIGNASAERIRERLTSANWKLEYVVGRHWEVGGDLAYGFLPAFDVALPNEAHILLGVHLLLGGTQATVNFDTGIELAVELITGARELPAHAPADFRHSLDRWREWWADTCQDANVMVSFGHEGLNADLAGGTGQLLKLHGGRRLESPDCQTVAPVITDTQELRLLEQADDISSLALSSDSFVVACYGGFDVDIFNALIRGLRGKPVRWVDPYPTYRLEGEITRLPNTTLVKSFPAPDLREMLVRVTGTLPLWPDTPFPNCYQTCLEAWGASLSPAASLETLGYLCLDARDFETSEALYHRVPRALWNARSFVRRGDLHYHRNQERERVRSFVLYLLAAFRKPSDPTGLVRAGRCYRSLRDIAVLRLPILALSTATLRLAVLLGMLFRRRSEVCDAWQELGHTYLRAAESQLGRGRLLGAGLLTRWALSALKRGLEAEGGHSRAYGRLLLVEAEAIARLLAVRSPCTYTVDNARSLLVELRDAYERLGDNVGSANTLVTEALLTIPTDRSGSMELVDRAEALYAGDKSGRRMVALVRSVMSER